MIFDGKMSSLRRFKDDAKEVATGFECGIGIENYNDLKPGDIIEAYQIELITPELVDSLMAVKAVVMQHSARLESVIQEELSQFVPAKSRIRASRRSLSRKCK